jgi:hypothetical protein
MVGGGGGRPSDSGSRRGRNRWRTPQGRVTARSARTLDTGPRRSRPVAAPGHGRRLRRTPRRAGRPRHCGTRRPSARLRATVSGLHAGSSTAVACGRSAAGHPSGTADRRRHRHGHRHQPGQLCRTPSVRRVVVPEAADGQSADRSGRYNFLYASSRPARRGASGRPCGPATTGRPPGNRPHREHR